MIKIKHNTLIRYKENTVAKTELDCLVTFNDDIYKCISYWSDGYVSAPYIGSGAIGEDKAILLKYLSENEALAWKLKYATTKT